MTARFAPLKSTFLAMADGFDLPDWSELEATLTERMYRAKSCVFQQGEENQSLYFVATGLVKLCYESRDGAHMTKSILPELSIFASRNALDGAAADFSAIALEPTTLVQIPMRQISALIAKHHGWERVAKTFFAALSSKKERKEFLFLTMSAEERWQAFEKDNPDICKRITQIELSALLGITPVALSRIKRRARSRQLAQS